MKNKLVVMFLTLLIMIAITPFVFSKLMNSKFDTMLLSLQQQQGIKIKEIKNKSGYLKTDRIFLVDIPGKKLNNNFIKDLYFKVETTFNNLPVTKVNFKGVLEKIDLNDKADEAKINTLFDKKIKFFATTPNFKVYTYKFEDINLPFNHINAGVKDIKGILEYSEIVNNKLNIGDVYLKMKNVLLEIKNIKNSSFYKKDNFKSENNFNVFLNFGKNRFQIENIHTLTNTDFKGKTNIISKFSFDKFISDYLNINQFMLNVNISKLDTKSLISIANTNDVNITKELTFELLKKGFEINLNSKVKNIEVAKKDLGYFLIDADLKIKPDNNLQKDLEENNLSFLNSHIYYESSPEIATVLMNLFPKSAFVFALAGKKGGKVILNINLKNSKLFVNGEEIK
ncbi:hypothetical protein [Lebetimonas sp. JH292]|uniref:hypothetical protein n=1 Tax=Lebetimonas sp. JH292 TaxID=990068 RepID=UPI000467583F|nr:hypothetical protein [Lebetimonas sp. JH292]